MKTVLLVSYHFPPDAAVGAFRCQKFAKYLPDYGWTPHVLTVHERYHPLLDQSRLAEIGQVPIRRTRMLPSPWGALLAARAALFRAFGHQRYIDRRVQANQRMGFEQRDRVDAGFTARLRRLALSVGRMPDDQIGWLAPAVIAGLRICQASSVNGIVTSGPPHSAHLVGLWLSRLTGIRWIADFRDPWVGNPQRTLDSRSGLSDRIESAMEAAVVRRADRVVLLTERSREAFVHRYPGDPPTKFITIMNGFDADDFSSLGSVSPEPAFTIAHVGSLYYRRSPGAFLAAVANLIERGAIPKADLQVVFAGVTADGHDVARMTAAGPLSGIVRITGALSHPEALAWMRRADLLCLFAQSQMEQIPAKAFEYLAAGAPILAITGNGATGDLIAKAGGSTVPDEPWAIEEVVLQQYVRYRAGFRPGVIDRPWVREEVRGFDRRALTGHLASLLLAEPGS